MKQAHEITYREKLGVSEARIQKMIHPKEQLEAFLPVRGRPGRPDYMPGEVMEMLRREFADPTPEV